MSLEDLNAAPNRWDHGMALVEDPPTCGTTQFVPLISPILLFSPILFIQFASLLVSKLPIFLHRKKVL